MCITIVIILLHTTQQKRRLRYIDEIDILIKSKNTNKKVIIIKQQQ